MHLTKKMWVGVVLQPVEILGSLDYGVPILEEKIAGLKDSYIGCLEEVYKGKDFQNDPDPSLIVGRLRELEVGPAVFWEIPSRHPEIRVLYSPDKGEFKYVVENTSYYYGFNSGTEALDWSKGVKKTYESRKTSLRALLREWRNK